MKMKQTLKLMSGKCLQVKLISTTRIYNSYESMLMIELSVFPLKYGPGIR